MDGFISNLKNKLAPKRSPSPEDEQERDRSRLEEVHAALSKVDPNTMDSTMVDVEDMTSLTDVSHEAVKDNLLPPKDEVTATNSKTNLRNLNTNSHSVLNAATVAALSIFKTPAETEEPDDLSDPQDDIFIYYD